MQGRISRNERTLKNIHKEYAKEGGTIQMLVRMGKTTKEFPLSMRRNVLDLIEE